MLGMQIVEHELMLFAAFWFLIGALDDCAIDAVWIWLRITGRGREGRISDAEARRELGGRTAVMIACWHEADVIGHTVRHALRAWSQRDLRLYVGCYANDPATLAAAMKGAGEDRRVRIVVHWAHGPTTKADCLNALYRAIERDEARTRTRYRAVVIHDSEDMVHPAELAAIDGALDDVGFVQLPVRPEPQPQSRWIAGHYSDEFTEAHAKALVVRDALGAGIPAAGTGCGFARDVLARIATSRLSEGEQGPFASGCLTEDYELGLMVSRLHRGVRFLRMRDERGQLVATRSYFPASLEASVRQKSRWIHGIALQGWDRLGWSLGPVDLWMIVRDRRGPLTALVLAAGYALLVIEAALGVARLAGADLPLPESPVLKAMLAACLVAFVWRALLRFAFTSSEYGSVEGLCAILRMPVANIIAIMAGRRALSAYARTLFGLDLTWDKTVHARHPVLADRGLVPSDGGAHA